VVDNGEEQKQQLGRRMRNKDGRIPPPLFSSFSTPDLKRSERECKRKYILHHTPKRKLESTLKL
jgi:hypothetical protein